MTLVQVRYWYRRHVIPWIVIIGSIGCTGDISQRSPSGLVVHWGNLIIKFPRRHLWKGNTNNDCSRHVCFFRSSGKERVLRLLKRVVFSLSVLPLYFKRLYLNLHVFFWGVFMVLKGDWQSFYINNCKNTIENLGNYFCDLGKWSWGESKMFLNTAPEM